MTKSSGGKLCSVALSELQLLRSLKLKSSFTCVPVIRSLAALREMTSLSLTRSREANSRENEEVDAAVCASLLHLTRLVSLKLSGFCLQDRIPIFTVGFGELKRRINSMSSFRSDPFADLLWAIGSMAGLSRLSLDNVGIAVDGLVILLHVLGSLSRLEQLKLSDMRCFTFFDKDGAAEHQKFAVERLSGLRLKSLCLDNCGVTSAVLVDLAQQMSSMKVLTALSLRDNPKIGFEGADALRDSLPCMLQLRRLECTAADLTPDGVQVIEAAVPICFGSDWKDCVDLKLHKLNQGGEGSSSSDDSDDEEQMHRSRHHRTL